MKALALVSDSPPETPPATTMKAIVQKEYGGPDKLELRDVPTPELDDVVRLEDRYGRAGTSKP